MTTMTIQKKDRREWKDVDMTTDDAYTYKKLARDLIGKYVEKGSWIKRVEESLSADGKVITVTYDNGYRTVYTIEWWR